MTWAFDKLKRRSFLVLTYVPILVLLVATAFLVRFFRKAGLLKPKFDVGLGPEPMINNVYHKGALEEFGWSAETFVSHVYFITNDFDYSTANSRWPMRIASYWLFLRILLRYRILYIYFNGGPLAWTDHYRFEAQILKLAGIKTVLMPYGSDIYDLSLCPNLLFKNAFMESYPNLQRERRSRVQWQVEYWSRRADHVIGGCDWVDYMWRWDTLIPAHFAVDTALMVPSDLPTGKKLRVLHAPNHRQIKGTSSVIEAIEKLRTEGADIELVLVERVSNAELLQKIRECHIVVDQLIIGWYGMFAVEAMALGRPVICYLRDDLVKLYRSSGAFKYHSVQPPLINGNTVNLADVLRKILEDRSSLESIARHGKSYVERTHSLQAIGSVFDQINRRLI